MPREIKVTDNFRKNELSVIPGGETIKVIKQDGTSVVYDKIKSIRAYSMKAMKDPNIIEIIVNGNTFWKRHAS